MSGAIPPATWPAAKRAVCLEYPDTPQWTALLSGVIQLLSFGYYWNKDYDNWEDARDAGQEIYQSWMAQIRCDAGAIPVDEPQCVDYPNNSPLLDWQPQNPFTDPGGIPPGYVAQPWGVVGEPAVFPYQTGDVISGLFGLPVLTPALNQGLARVRIKFRGVGTVEVHIIKVALGGIALLTWDDNPFTARFVDTSMDFLALPPESGDEDIQEIEFETEGDHHIDVTMLPRFSAEVGFAGYGGGIRKVVLCGPDLQFVDNPGQEFEVDEFMTTICDSIRFQDGKLQAFCCNMWTDVAGQPEQGVGGPGQPGGGAPQPPAGGGQVCYNGKFSASSKWLVPTLVNTGDVVELQSYAGAGQDGSVDFWRCPDGRVFFAGSCTGTPGPATGDPLNTANHMALIYLIDGTYYDAMSGPVTIPGGVSNAQVEVQINDSALGDNSGSYDIRLCVTNNAEVGFVHDFNFPLTPGAWKIGHRPTGNPTGNTNWVPGTGFVSVADEGEGTNTGVIELWLEGVNLDGCTVRMIGDTPASLSNNGIYTAADGTYPDESAISQYLTSHPQTSIDITASGFTGGVQDLVLLIFAPYDGATVRVLNCIISGPGADPF